MENTTLDSTLRKVLDSNDAIIPIIVNIVDVWYDLLDTGVFDNEPDINELLLYINDLSISDEEPIGRRRTSLITKVNSITDEFLQTNGITLNSADTPTLSEIDEVLTSLYNLCMQADYNEVDDIVDDDDIENFISILHKYTEEITPVKFNLIISDVSPYLVDKIQFFINNREEGKEESEEAEIEEAQKLIIQDIQFLNSELIKGLLSADSEIALYKLKNDTEYTAWLWKSCINSEAELLPYNLVAFYKIKGMSDPNYTLDKLKELDYSIFPNLEDRTRLIDSCKAKIEELIKGKAND